MMPAKVDQRAAIRRQLKEATLYSAVSIDMWA